LTRGFIGTSLLRRDSQLVGATEVGLPNCGGYIPVCSSPARNGSGVRIALDQALRVISKQ
jgi:hypothetical protein